MIESPALRVLNRHLKKKKQEFRGFSVRWMASKLSVSPAYMSQILNGKRRIPAHLVDSLCGLLDVDSEKRATICRQLLHEQGWNRLTPSASRSSTAQRAVARSADWSSVPIQHFEFLSDWHHIAIMETTLLKDYDGTAEFIGRRLGLREPLIRAAIKNLEEAGYLKLIDGKLRKSKPFFEFHSKNAKAKIRQYHKLAMAKAHQALDKKVSDADLEERLITSATFTCSAAVVSELKAKIATFLKELTTEAAASEPEEVYQFAIQFFPLTEKNEK